MRGAQCFAVYELYSSIDVCMCICLYIAERALYMCVHDVANPLLVADNVISEHSRGLFLKPLNVTLH